MKSALKSANFLVIMAGGTGTRFWPKSTKDFPKQFLKIGPESKAKDRTLLQLTWDRFQCLKSKDLAHDAWVVTTRALEKNVIEQLPQLDQVLSEPIGKNTAPCIYWVCKKAIEESPSSDPLLWVMPSDHYIKDEAIFESTIATASQYALENNALVTLGIKPTRAETGYGYLEVEGRINFSSKQWAAQSAPGIWSIRSFREKPNRSTADEYLAKGGYFWNGGMFVFRASVMLEAFDRLAPEFSKIWKESGGDVERFYQKVPSISIDYCIFEKSQNIAMVEFHAGWDDLGAWTSLEGLAEKESPSDNVVESGDVRAVSSTGNIIDVAPTDRVSLLGVHDLIIARSGNEILIAHKSRSQEIKVFQN